MLRHKCPKCGNELGYKCNTSLFKKEYMCPKCKIKLETTGYVASAMIFALILGIIATDYIAPLIGTFSTYRQATKGIVTFLAIVLIWFIISAVMPNQLSIKENQYGKKGKRRNKGGASK